MIEFVTNHTTSSVSLSLIVHRKIILRKVHLWTFINTSFNLDLSFILADIMAAWYANENVIAQLVIVGMHSFVRKSQITNWNIKIRNKTVNFQTWPRKWSKNYFATAALVRGPVHDYSNENVWTIMGSFKKFGLHAGWNLIFFSSLQRRFQNPSF